MMESWLTKTSPWIDMLFHWDTHYPNNDSIQSALNPSYYILSGEPVYTNFVVLTLLWDRKHDLQHLR